MSYAIKKFFVRVLGNLHLYPFRLKAQVYRVSGADTREISHLVEPGDVLLREVRNCLGNWFVPRGETGCDHSGVYVGNDMVAHMTLGGAVMTDLIEYCRADKIMVLRPLEGQEYAVQFARECVDKKVPYDYAYSQDTDRYYCHELVATCFPRLHFIRAKWLRIWSASPEVYLPESLYASRGFVLVHTAGGETTTAKRPVELEAVQVEEEQELLGCASRAFQ